MVLTNNDSVNKIFLKDMNNVFSSSFISEISRFIKKPIVVKKSRDEENIAAKTEVSLFGKPILYLKNNSDSSNTSFFIFHEFLHILMILGSSDLKTLAKKLYYIISQNTKNVSDFLIGNSKSVKKIPDSLMNYQEAVCYFMNGTINWDSINDKGKKLIFETIKKSNIFNIDSSFWKANNRLGGSEQYGSSNSLEKNSIQRFLKK